MTATTLIPAPVHATALPGPALCLRAGATVLVGSAELAGLARTFITDVEHDTGLALQIGDSGASIHIGLTSLGGDAEALEALPHTGGLRADAREPDDERYGLEVTADLVRVWAATAEGVHRGLTSLRQLIIGGHQSNGTAVVAPMRVLDTPRFAWRGLSLDVARTFHDAQQLRRVIDMLSLHKLNVLHLHLTDDQGWRVPIPGWPALTEIGGAGAVGDRPGGSYTVEELAGIVAYAQDRFITIVPEIDMPGHAQAIFRSYAELAPADPQEPVGPLAIGTLDPDNEITWRFVRDVLTEVAALFPYSRFLHIGADEAFGMADDAYASFVSRAAGIARCLGRNVIAWQEAARANVGPDDIVQYWIETREMKAALEQGVLAQVLPQPMADIVTATMAKAEHDVDLAAVKGAAVLLSPTSHLYLDRPYAEPSADPDGEAMRARLGLPFYPAKTVEQSYDWEPQAALAAAASAGLPTAAGVEAAVWCETVTCGQDLEFLLLPRLAGVAERAWSPAGVGTWHEYRHRLATQATAWARRGWTWFRSSAIAWWDPSIMDSHS